MSKILLPGVLHTDSKVKYGTEKGKLIYLFEPYERRYGDFYVPSKYMHQTTKKYAYVECEEGGRRGVVQDYLGDVGDLEAEYLYLKYICGLHTIKPLKNVVTTTLTPPSPSPSSYKVYSIDPPGCKDIDDAFHYDEALHQIGIHIAYPWKFLQGGGEGTETLSLFLQRVSTLYMPHKSIPMMHTSIAEDLASLLEKTNRYAITILYQLDEAETTILQSDIQVESTVYVVKNYDYDTVDAIFAKEAQAQAQAPAKERMLRKWREVSQRIFQKELDAHKIVEAWMIYTNQTVATRMVEQFGPRVLLRTMRETAFQEANAEEDQLPTELSSFLRITKTEGAEYRLYDASEEESSMRHALMGSTTYYTHFTSPIRRFCDLYLQALLASTLLAPEVQRVAALPEAQRFGESSPPGGLGFELREEDVAHINTVTRSMRKYQRMCQWTEFIYQPGAPVITTYAYIYEICAEKRLVRLYLNGMATKKSVVQKRFEEITEVEWVEAESLLRVKDEDGIREYRLYERRRVRVYLYPNRHRLQERMEIFFCD